MKSLLNEGGDLSEEGWAFNHPWVLNNQHLFGSTLRQRNLNFFQMQVGGYHFNMIMPIQVGPVCISKVQWFR